jgi:2-alkyl-3-oxoalkanoate reductase
LVSWHFAWRREFVIPNEIRVFITGASGFLGSRIVSRLVQSGYEVRALVRKSSQTDHIRLPGVEIAFGNVTNVESLKPAFDGIDFVIHTAADTRGTEEGARQVTIQGTRNILNLCDSNAVKKLIYISSCSVYGVADYQKGQVIDEHSPLERFPERRGAYTWGKLEAEKLVTKYMIQKKVPVVCLRPGTIWGIGGESFTPMIGFSFGTQFFVVIGDGRLVLPLVYIDNLVEAVIASITSQPHTMGIYNVIDPEAVDKKCYMDNFIRKLYPGSLCLYLPYGLLYSATWLQEKLSMVLRRRPVLTCYRLTSSQKPILYDSSKISHDLGWRPLISFNEALDTVLRSKHIR